MDKIEELKKENEQLKILSENKSEIISITAHQLRTSLSALKWILKMLMDEDAGKLTNEQSELIEKAYGSNEHILAIVNDLLTFSHTEGATAPYKFKSVDLLRLVEKILFEFQEETNKKGIELVFLTPDKSIPSVSCDEEMIRVVVENLIENSIKYSNINGKVFISLKQKDSEVQISIHDSGIGIKDEDKDNIFKKFYRAKNATEKDPIGSGLGLFTTKNIVEKHNGKIWFENKDGEGTTFFVSLPVL